jgi:hypothetical protein
MKVKVKIKMTKKEVDMLYTMLLINKKIQYNDVVIEKLYLSDKQKKKLGTIDIC